MLEPALPQQTLRGCVLFLRLLWEGCSSEKQLCKHTTIFICTESSFSPGSVRLVIVIKKEGTAYLLENKWTSEEASRKEVVNHH